MYCKENKIYGKSVISWCLGRAKKIVKMKLILKVNKVRVGDGFKSLFVVYIKYVICEIEIEKR